MKSPEEALAAARQRASGSMASVGPGSAENDQKRTSLQQLAEWALIEPDEAKVYSTRRFGGPVTMLKRGLIRLLRQYLFQLSAQQTRFNAHVVRELTRLDERVRTLEAAGAEPHRADEADQARQ
jgi:hypothetical protein